MTIQRCYAHRNKRSVRLLAAYRASHALRRNRAAATLQWRWRKHRALRCGNLSRERSARFRFAASKKDADDHHDEVEAGELATWSSQFLRFMTHPLSTVKHPAQYLSINGELFALVLGVSWLLTLIFNPGTIHHNALLEAWGYNNICVGLDLAPARQVAAVGWTLITWSTFEYVRTVVGKQRQLLRSGVLKPHLRSLCAFFNVYHVSFA